MQIELPDKIDISDSICSICTAGQAWQEGVTNYIRSKGLDYEYGKPYPANSPQRAAWNEYYNKSSKICINFEYDDCLISVCLEHMEQIVDELRKKTKESESLLDEWGIG